MTSTIERDSVPDAILHARGLRERILRDPWRPAVHFCSPEGPFNDPNGLIFHGGRYHMFNLPRTPIPDAENPDEDRWVEVADGETPVPPGIRGRVLEIEAVFLPGTAKQVGLEVLKCNRHPECCSPGTKKYQEV